MLLSMRAHDVQECIDKIAFGLTDHCLVPTNLTLLEHKWIFWLSVTTSAAFIVLAIPRISHLLFRCPRATITRAPIFILAAKIITNTVLASLRLSLLVIAIQQYQNKRQHTRHMISTSMDFAASLLLLALSPLEHLKSIRPSILACMFLLLGSTYDAARLAILWSSYHQLGTGFQYSAFRALFTAVLPVELIFLVLESTRRRAWNVWNPADHSPEETSSVLSLGIYGWLSPLLWRGYHEPLTMQHLYALDQKLSIDVLSGSKVTNPRQNSTGTSNWQLTIWLFMSLGRSLILPVLPRLFLLGFTFCQPFFIQRLLSFLSSPREDSLTASALISVAVFTYLGIAVSTALYWYYQERFQSILRAFLISSIYQKTAHIQHVGDGDTAAVTLMGADVERVYTGLRLMHEVWAHALQIALSLWLLYRQVGIAFLAPLIVVFIGFAISFALSKRAVSYQRAWMARIQERTGITSAMLTHIKDLRVSGMITAATSLVKSERESEIKVGERSRVITAVSASLSQLPQAVAPALLFACGPHKIDHTRAFTALSLLTLLTSPLMVVLQIFPIIAAAFACLRRIREFLIREGRVDGRLFNSQSNGRNEKDGPQDSRKEVTIAVEDGNFGWTEQNAVLKNINMRLLKSSITFVIGPNASGKSTLCRALLGEVPFARGTVILGSTKLGYCDQIPFLFNTSVKENIVGFSFFDAARYTEVIEATMLAEDLESWTLRDTTIVGNKGISLSGGQRQRISLARALYHDAELLVLDDIFSGLDGPTQEKMCLSVFGPSGLLRRRGTTTLVCTHATQFLSSADYVVSLSSDGTIDDQGLLSDISQDGQRAQRIGLTYPLKTDPQTDREDPDPNQIVIHEVKASRIPALIRRSETPSTLLDSTSVAISTPIADLKVYTHWLSTIGSRPLLLFLLLVIGNGFFSNFPTIWLKWWSSDSILGFPEHSFGYWMGIYALFGVATVLCVLPAGLIMLRTGVRLTGTNLHHAAIDTVMHSSLRYLSTTDVGKALNLLSQDMNILDTQLPRMVNNMSFTLSNAIGQAVVIAVSSAWLAVSYPLFIATLLAVQRVYLPTSKRLRILDLEAKTPLYTNFLDTLHSLPTIRAFGWFPQQQARNNFLLDRSQRPSYLLAMAQQWLMFIMNLIVAILAVILVAMATQLRSNAGSVGAGFVTLMSLGSALTTVIVAYTGLETSLGAITRLKAFSDDTEMENGQTQGIVPPQGWPLAGEINIQEVDATYTGNEMVLKRLNLSIKAREKVAICGRTGSGKSSILSLLLRIIDPQSSDRSNLTDATSGILIDGVPLNTISHTTLRERIFSVSQDAVFFPDGCSFGDNLDPWKTATIPECLSVLQDLDLLTLVEAKGGLNAPANRAELSSGQRQLFGLARVVLRRRVKIRETGIDGGLLLLDEITSSADAETERRFSRLLDVDFQAYTVIIVTHHRQMAVVCDRVVVLDSGMVVEDGKPGELLGKQAGWFRALWEK
ncbi:ABC transporter [Cadophora sp. MPI-SDFR-AT-0126]|nr:ABC transporter [Leotiomycetes sp. MPI-SDFR-AT-0126]